MEKQMNKLTIHTQEIPAEGEEEKKQEVNSRRSLSKEKKLKLQDFDILGILGRGSYGEVALVRKKEDGSYYALKIIDKAFIAREKKQYQVYVEKEVLSRLSNPGVIKLYYSFQDKSKLYFALEYMKGGPLSELMSIKKKLPVDIIRFYAAEIVIILEYLHNQGIIHRDVKPNNLMLNEQNHLKIIDFGTAKFFESSCGDNELFQKMQALHNNMDADVVRDQTKHRSTFVGTAEYVSPELLEDNQTGPPSDLWALGCIMYQMYTGSLPFSASNEYLIFEKIKSGNIAFPPEMAFELKDIISKLLIRDPDQRLGGGPKGSSNDFTALKTHPFFSSINFETLQSQEAPYFDYTSPYKKVETSERSMELNVDLGLIEGFTVNTNGLSGYKETSPSRSPARSPLGKPPHKGSHDLTWSDPKLILSGVLLKKCGWIFYKPRSIELYEPPRILYYDPEDHSLKGEIKITKGTKIEYDGPDKFMVKLPHRTYYFKENETPINKWVDMIRSAMLRFFGNDC